MPGRYVAGDSTMEEDAGWKHHYIQIVQTGKRCPFWDSSLNQGAGLGASSSLGQKPCAAPSAALPRGPSLSCIRTSLKMAGWELGKVRRGTG